MISLELLSSKEILVLMQSPVVLIFLTSRISDIQHRWIFNSEIQARHDTFVSYPEGSSDQTFARLVRALERIDSNKITI
jgi:hypothetical protein